MSNAIERFYQRRYKRLMSRLDAAEGHLDAEGRWITTKEKKRKVHLNEEGIPDKGNPFIIAKMTGTKPKLSTGYRMKSLKDFLGKGKAAKAVSALKDLPEGSMITTGAGTTYTKTGSGFVSSKGKTGVKQTPQALTKILGGHVKAGKDFSISYAPEGGAPTPVTRGPVAPTPKSSAAPVSPTREPVAPAPASSASTGAPKPGETASKTGTPETPAAAGTPSPSPSPTAPTKADLKAALDSSMKARDMDAAKKALDDLPDGTAIKFYRGSIEYKFSKKGGAFFSRGFGWRSTDRVASLISDAGGAGSTDVHDLSMRIPGKGPVVSTPTKTDYKASLTSSVESHDVAGAKKVLDDLPDGSTVKFKRGVIEYEYTKKGKRFTERDISGLHDADRIATLLADASSLGSRAVTDVELTTPAMALSTSTPAAGTGASSGGTETVSSTTGASTVSTTGGLRRLFDSAKKFLDKHSGGWSYHGSGKEQSEFFKSVSNCDALIRKLTPSQKDSFVKWCYGHFMSGQQYRGWDRMSPTDRKITKDMDTVLDQATLDESVEVRRLATAELVLGAGHTGASLAELQAMKGKTVVSRGAMSCGVAAEGLTIGSRKAVEYKIAIPGGTTGAGMWIGDKRINPSWGAEQREFVMNRDTEYEVGETTYDAARGVYVVELAYKSRRPHDYGRSGR